MSETFGSAGAEEIVAPDGFLWGVAISAHQSEGGNVNSDCWLAETVRPTVFRAPSADACDSYARYPEDLTIARDLGFNTYRLGIEWARIEPEPGMLSSAALDHYTRVLDAARERGLKPMITFNHFTVPRWFAARGGFEAAGAADLFGRFADHASRRLGDRMAAAMTFNEANILRLIELTMVGARRRERVGAMLAACARASGSDRFSSLLFADLPAAEPHLLAAHRQAAAAIRANAPGVPLVMSLTMQHVEGVGDNHNASTVTEALYGPWLAEARSCDFTGVQTYTRIRTGKDRLLPPPDGAELTAAGYEFRPQALGDTIRFAAEAIGRPILVTENGLATDDDSRRIAFIDAALAEVRTCLREGIDVRGYIYWSLLDNFEWTRGYGERFGLVHVDFDTFKRTVKQSAHHLGARARGNRI